MAKNADKLYQAMKAVAKKRKIKSSPQHDLYWTCDPYFFSSRYFWWDASVKDNKVKIGIDISVKYWRFDELQYSITDPESDFRFTDKTRANSSVMCCAQFPRIEHFFSWDGTDETIPELCQDILDWITAYQMSYAHLTFSIAPETEEQKKRLERYGYAKGQNFFYRDIKSVLIDYSVAKQQGLDWDKDLRNFGLLLKYRCG